MQSNAFNSTATELDPAINDLGPLAWVLDELRKSLDGAAKALKRFVRDAEAARGSDLGALDASQLRLARQQLHQAVGALEMVGLAGPALVLRSMEAAVQRFVQQPGQCSQDAAAKIERASFALTEYLEGLLADRPVSAVSLFPQYRDVQELVRADRIHPADLWANEWRWLEPQFEPRVPAQVYGDAVRATFDQSVLQIMKGNTRQSALTLKELALGLSVGQADRQCRIFWVLAAAYFEAITHGLIGSDVYVRRAASRILLQYLALSKGNPTISERLAQDLLFFCSQAIAARAIDTPVLSAVRAVYGLARFRPVEYETVQFGRFDPALLAQARKRIVSAKETWSSLSAGDVNKFKLVVDQFSLVTDSLVKLHPPSEPLAQALTRAVEKTAQSGTAPDIELAMEVATSVLYLEAAFEDLDPRDAQLADRTRHLAERLDGVRTGGQPQPLESWMEELYRRVSDKQTMGSVVGELRVSLSELEKSLDQFFRNPADKAVLRGVPGQLSQMRGVLSVLGLGQASQAVLRMRDSVEQMLVTEVDEQHARAAGTFDALGNNLGALSFLIDMLNYQPSLAKKLFVYDDVKGELKPLMGRTNRIEDAAASITVHGEEQANAGTSADVVADIGDAAKSTLADLDMGAFDVVAQCPAIVAPAQEVSLIDAQAGKQPTEQPAELSVQLAAEFTADVSAEYLLTSSSAADLAPLTQVVEATTETDDFEEDDLLDIFLDEAREVSTNGLEAVRALAEEPGDISQLTILRRAFHTLKGSSRMVGLTVFGDAAWSMEQVLNSWLADQKPASKPLQALAGDALAGFALWIEDIASGQDKHWDALSFQIPADAMRTEGRSIPLVLPTCAVSDSSGTVAPQATALPLVVMDDEALPLSLEPVLVDVTASGGQADDIYARFDFGLSDTSTTVVTVASPDLADAEDYMLELSEPMSDAGIPALYLSTPIASMDEPVAANGAPNAEPQAIETQTSEVDGFSFDADVEIDNPGLADQAHDASGESTQPAPLPSNDLSRQFLVVEAASETNNLETGKEGDAAIEALFIDVPTPAEDGEALAWVRSDGHADDLTSNPLPPEIAALDVEPVVETVKPPEVLAVELNQAEEAVESAASASSLVDEIEATSAETEFFDSSVEEQIKVIGNLRIGIPLYNVYLNEADEWSRRLVTDLSEWAFERQHPVNDLTVGFAHSLAGSSATVGFEGLSEISRALEHALQQSQNHDSESITQEHAALFLAAAEDIRRLLHQFAAGFLKEPDAGMLQRLKMVDFVDLAPPVELGDDSLDLSGTEPAAAVAASAGFAPVEETAIPGTPPAQAASASNKPVATNLQSAAAQTVAVQAPQDALEALALRRAEAAPPVPVASVPMPPLQVSSFSDDEIDAVDAIDAELFPIFEEEAAELVPQLGAVMRQWVARPTNQGGRMEVLRVLHTLKGSARLAGALRLGEMAHRIESEIEFLGSEASAAQDFESLLVRFDMLEGNFEALRAADLPSFVVQPLQPLRATGTSAHDEVAPASTDAAVPSMEPLDSALMDMTEADLQLLSELDSSASEADISADSQAASRVMVPAPQAMAMQPVRQAASASIRVRSQLLDRMVNQAGEVMITRSRLEVELGQLRASLGDMNGNLNRLRQQLRDIELQAETQMQSRLAQAKELQAGFDPLEFDRFTRVQELTRMMAESVNDVATVQRTLQRTVEATEDDLIAQARQTRELQRDLLRTRMVEFEGISDRLYRVVRLASKETGKQVRLDLLGGTIEMDRAMLDRMTPAFEHLLRNCVAHGIESPEVRGKAGKDPVGLITVHLRQEGNDVSVDFSDDGAGLDLSRIREKAVASGLIAPDQQLSSAEAANLIFLPGFSTASQVTELAGRGIGMDVVRSEINSIGGRIETTTVEGSGTHFKLVLPLTTAVTQVVMLRAGSLSIGVPANLVETVRRATAKDLQQAYNTGLLDVAGEMVPFYWSGALLQASHRSGEVQGKTTPVVVLRSAAQKIAVHVDEVLGNQEVVVKNLGPQLSRLPGLAGLSVLASGAVVLIYNPVALSTIYGAQARALSQDSAEPHMLEASAVQGGTRAAIAMPAVNRIPLIMVVDDSITVRRVTQRLLQREGYRVVMAADGLQALERLQDELPAVVLSDIEMPRMDGFDLARNIRGDARLKALPIVMITSRIAEKHRDHAKELGVDHYLGKPYSEDELMGLVRYYCNRELAVA
ncbi:MAG: response regulator [Polaromonas sp.]|nr:response regulator [Polaromonas sp.]